MTIEQIEAVLVEANIKIAVRQRFAFDSGTLLRLENFVMINLFDDGRYYVQGSKANEILAVLSLIEAPWDPDDWNGQMPKQAAQNNFPLRFPPQDPFKRF